MRVTAALMEALPSLSATPVHAGARRAIVGLLLAALPVFLLFLGANSIWDANEAFYVETPRQMLLRGDYVTPVFNDAPRLNKPVLSYWIVAGLYHALGVSVTTERLGIGLGALGILLATFMVGRALRSTTTGLVAALLLATSPRFVMFARRIFIDIYITLFMSIALAGFVLAVRHPEHRRRYLLLMYVAIGLGVLTKGPIAVVIPVVVGALWCWRERRWPDARRWMIGPGLLVMIAIVAPWYALLVNTHGWTPLTSFVIGENLERYTNSMVPGDRPIWYYVQELLADLFLPWAPLLVVPLLTAWRRSGGGETSTHHAIRHLLWLWVVVFVGVFSLSQTKQDLYILPVAPAAAVLIADVLLSTRFTDGHRVLRVIVGLVGALCVICAPLMFWLFGSGYYVLPGIRLASLLLAAGGCGVIVAVLRHRGAAAVFVLAGTFVVFNYLFVVRILPGMERLKPVVPIAQLFAARAGASAQLGSYHLMLPSLVYYAGRPVRILDSEAQAVEFYADARGGWAMMSDTELRELQRVVPGLCVAARRPMFDAKLRDVLDRRPPADVLLVTNRCTPSP
ncbi:MAG: glycosyltransferase family 39 protein [Vicinamibacterales bacterium]